MFMFVYFSDQMYNLNSYVRDFYFFRRNFYAQLTLIKKDPEEARKMLQKQVSKTHCGLHRPKGWPFWGFMNYIIQRNIKVWGITRRICSLLVVASADLCTICLCCLLLQAFILKFVEMGKVLFSHSITTGAPPQQVSWGIRDILSEFSYENIKRCAEK